MRLSLASFEAPVQGCLHRKRTFSALDYISLAVDRTRRRKYYCLNPITPHRLKHVKCRNGVLLQVLTGMIKPKMYVRISGEAEFAGSLPLPERASEDPACLRG